MKIRPLIVLLGLTAALGLSSGCASAGSKVLHHETETTVSQKLTEGQTTKAEVRKMFGSPAKTSFTDGGLEIWTYERSNLKADGVNYIPIVNLFGSSMSGVKKELVILFDSHDVVKRYSMSESPETIKTGIFN